jgi:hypothetical protein
MQRSIASIIEEAEKHTDPQKQADVLMKNSSAALEEILVFSMDPNVKWLLPETPPPYKPVSEGTDQEGRLYAEVRRLPYFVNTREGLEVKQIRREVLFIEFLETIAPADAKMILRAKNKALSISVEAVKIAFPGISKGW